MDAFSNVIGDGFHFMDRAKVAMYHFFKKSYFVTYREYLFVWNLGMLAN